MYDGSFASPLQGVSQQAARDRLDGQCETQVNLVSDAVKILSRRPPLTHLRTLETANIASQPLFFKYNDSLYSMFLKSGSAILYNVDTDDTYTLSGSIPSYVSADMHIASIADTVLISNPSVKITLDSYVENGNQNGVLVYCRGGVSTYTYKITVDSYTYSYTPTTSTLASGSNIISKLYDLMVADVAFMAAYTVAQVANVLKITKNAGTVPVVTVDDSGTGKDMVKVTTYVNDLADLPPYATDGWIVTVRGNVSSNADDYYLMFVSETGATTFGLPGVWAECAKPGERHYFNESTLPHRVVINQSAKTFSIEVADWKPRRVGDSTTNPYPSFVDNTINEISVFQGRFVLLSDSVFMTRTEDVLDCYRESATTLTDGDPIDIKSSVAQSERLNTSVQFNRNFIAYSDSTQFAVLGDVKVTPTNAALPVLSSFTSSRVAPATTGVSIISAYPFGEYSGLYEIFPSTAEDNVQYDKITAHVPSYIRGSITQIVSATNFDSLFIRSAGATNTIYVYKYLYAGNRKLQSSWSTWVFDFTVRFLYVDVDVLYVLYENGGKYILGVINLDYPNDTGLDYTVYLDNRYSADFIDGEATVDSSFDISKDIAVDVSDKLGVALEISSFDPMTNILTLSSDFTGTAFIGRPVYFEYTPNIPFVKDDAGKIIGTGLMNVLMYQVSVRDTGSFFTDILTTTNDVVSTREISSNRSGVEVDYNYDTLNLFTGSLKIPFQRNNLKHKIRFYGTSYQPFNLLDLEYTYRFMKAGRRV